MKVTILLISLALSSCAPDVPVQVTTKSGHIEEKDTIPRTSITVEVDTTYNEYDYDVVIAR